MKTKWRKYWLGIVAFLAVLLISWLPTPSYGHWADLSVAEITVEKAKTGIVLTFPTALFASGDDNRDGQISDDEVVTHKKELEKFISDRIHLVNEKGEAGAVSVTSSNSLPPNIQSNSNTHTTLELSYAWSQPVTGLTINYALFVPNVTTARCLATVIQDGKTQNLVFTPENGNFP